jgi:hypothetical protein
LSETATDEAEVVVVVEGLIPPQATMARARADTTQALRDLDVVAGIRPASKSFFKTSGL